MARAANRARGRDNRAAGGNFEHRIDATCKAYRAEGLALIDKTPEPMRIIKRQKGGIFLAVFTSAAQPDYKGTLPGGQSVVIEAKHTAADRIREAVITDRQREYLDLHTELGAACYVLAEVDGDIYRIPWTIFRDMKARYGRRYMTTDEMGEFQTDVDDFLELRGQMAYGDNDKNTDG